MASSNVDALVKIRDISYGKKVQACGIIQDGNVLHGFTSEGGSDWNNSVLGYRGSGAMWRTLEHSQINCCELAYLVMVAYSEQRRVTVFFIGDAVFWTVVIPSPAISSKQLLLEVERGLRGVKARHPDTIMLNSIFRGLGHIERCRYVVVEDPSLVMALDYFRRHDCDVDLIKRKVYGNNVVFVPESFPVHVPTLHQVLGRFVTKA